MPSKNGKYSRKDQKKKGSGHSSKAESTPPSEDDSTNDTASVHSMASETNQINGDETTGDSNEVDETSQIENFEDMVKDAMDGATQKCAQVRTNSIDAISKAFTQKYVPDFIGGRYLTISEIIKNSLRKGKGAEQAASAHLAALLCLQRSDETEASQVFTEFQGNLLMVASNNSADAIARAKCCHALGLCCLMSIVEDEDTWKVLETMESIFSASYLKTDGSIVNHAPDICSLHAAAVLAWALILTVMHPSIVYSLIESHMDRLLGLLSSSHLDLRIAAGEVIVVCYEIARDHNSEFDPKCTYDLCETLKQLATDSHKYRAKKERKQQRSSFRDIIRGVEEGESPNIQVRFGMESLVLDTWCLKKHYDAFCQVLGSGMNRHLTENGFLRRFFQLGAPVAMDILLGSRRSKLERTIANSTSDKIRTVSRNKSRDKRTTLAAY